jgi:hypothetical protein
MRSGFDNAKAKGRHMSQCFEIPDNRGICQES